MRVLIAPQEFKGSLSADEAASAIADGILAAQPAWQVDLLPMSDGGPGFFEAMRRALKTDLVAIAAHDALRRPLVARYLDVRGSRDILIEAAQANGLLHIRPEERQPLVADTFGVGELIASAVRHNPARIIIGVGGSATTDGGSGMAAALGARFLDASGNELPPGGGPLIDLARIDWTPPGWLAHIPVVVATDVTNPLLGTNGAATVYGPQKGATPADVAHLEHALTHFAEVIREQLGVDVSTLPGGGAAGGLAAGLVEFLRATVESGFDLVARATNLESRLSEADIIVTGEGRFDSQSIQGKTTGRLIELAHATNKPVVIFAGATLGASPIEVHTLTQLEPDSTRAMQNAASLLQTSVRTWASSLAR